MTVPVYCHRAYLLCPTLFLSTSSVASIQKTGIDEYILNGYTDWNSSTRGWLREASVSIRREQLEGDRGPHPGLKPGTPLPALGCTAPSPSRRSACSSWAEDSVPVLPLHESCCGTTQLPDSAPLLGFSWNLSGAWLSPTPCFHHPLHSVITIACVCGNYLHFVHYQETHLRTRSLVFFTLISRVLCIMPGKRQMPNSLT